AYRAPRARRARASHAASGAPAMAGHGPEAVRGTECRHARDGAFPGAATTRGQRRPGGQDRGRLRGARVGAVGGRGPGHHAVRRLRRAQPGDVRRPVHARGRDRLAPGARALAAECGAGSAVAAIVHVSTTEFILLALVAATGGAVQGSIGFGQNLVLVPIVALIVPEAVPGALVALGVPLTVIMAAREWHG